MKKLRIKYVIIYCVLAIIWSLLIISIFTGCNVYEHEEIEIIRCPQVQDTVQVPDWEEKHPDFSGF